MNRKNDISFEVIEKIGVLATYQSGWKKELNLVSWNGTTPKYDIRDWNPSHEHMSRGITLNEQEVKKFRELIADRDLAIPAGSRDKKEKDYER